MQSNNKIIIAAAGSGKTSELVNKATELNTKRILITTFTVDNTEEIRRKFFMKPGFIPENIKIQSWFSFLLNEGVRPYQNFLYSEKRIENIEFVTSQSTRGIPKTNVKNYYLKGGVRIYTDKMSDFILRVNSISNGKIINRLEKMYDVIMLDEVQDLAGYDLDFLYCLLQSNIQIIVVGDNRQSTFFTNHSTRHKTKRGISIPTFFRDWENEGLCEVEYRSECHRSNQLICDLADSLYPEMPKTKSFNNKITGHDGIFYIRSCDIEKYIEQFKPQILRYDKRAKIPKHYRSLNFGKSKGLTFDRTLIISNGPINKFLKTGDFNALNGSKAAYYVALTRAKYSVCVVSDEKNVSYPYINYYKP
ncbi:UvrD-helicase domain-containing protein [Lysinibacillus sphaericus]|uniref:UvrD-helicase domain-containing protein n=1 Tax=Lysinibacillus TaxID=400634 RepID=UPI00084A3C43|nr:UvrD-helicase domain-containing protein [Lysinibacillus sphaericus]UDK96986.1 UvrD-helicase domain-containing protein [Lysinibacillus sphaericus]